MTKRLKLNTKSLLLLIGGLFFVLLLIFFQVILSINKSETGESRFKIVKSNYTTQKLTNGWTKFTNLNFTDYSRYSISIPPGWDWETNAQEWRRTEGTENWLRISKVGNSINIYQSLWGKGGGECKGEKIDGNQTFYRVLSEDASSIRYWLCTRALKDKNGSDLQGTDFGDVWYDLTEHSEEMLEEMDEIVKTIFWEVDSN